MDKWMDQWTNDWMDDRINKWINKSMNEWINKWMNEWMIDWMNERRVEGKGGDSLASMLPAIHSLGPKLINWINLNKPN